jgi:hypothetical protein
MKNSKKGIVYGMITCFIISVALWVSVGITPTKKKNETKK